MKRIKNKVLLSTLQHKVLLARKDYMLPFQLVDYVLSLNVTSDIEKVRFLGELTQHYLRVKGYYKRYVDIARQSDIDIKNEYERRFGK